MDLRAHLAEGFDYDVWANRRWIAALPLFADDTRPREVMQHIYFAQRIWLLRAHEWLGLDAPDLPEGWSPEKMERVMAEFQSLLSNADLDQVHHWTRMRDGLARSNTLGQIVRHVINHGTYHRGHLRGLAEAAGIADFPDTDYIFYLDEKA